MKVAQIIFADDKYNYNTSVNPECSNEDIVKYFKGQLLEMKDETMQRVIKVRFKYKVVAGSFAGEIGFLDPFEKFAFLPVLRVEGGNRLAVAMSQLEQVI